MNVSLLEFLKTGFLRPTHLGMSAQDILDLIGPPDNGEETLPAEGITIWRYGNFFIGFGEGEVGRRECTSLQWAAIEEEYSFPSALEIDDWNITRDITPEQMKAYLRDNGLQFRYRTTKGYFERKPVTSETSPEIAWAAQNLGFLVFKKPKNEE